MLLAQKHNSVMLSLSHISHSLFASLSFSISFFLCLILSLSSSSLLPPPPIIYLNLCHFSTVPSLLLISSPSLFPTLQANLEYLYNKYEDSCTIYRGDICDVDFIGNNSNNNKIDVEIHIDG